MNSRQLNTAFYPDHLFTPPRVAATPRRAWLGAALALASLGLSAAPAATPAPAPAAPWNPLAAAPLYFEANRGQADAPARFVARGRDCDVLLAPTEAVLVLEREAKSAAAGFPLLRLDSIGHQAVQTRCVRVRLEDADPEAPMTGLEPLAGRVNYFIGNDPADWRRGIPLFHRVRIDGIYPGIGLVYYATESAALEFDFIVQPGARPGRIALRLEGVDRVRVDAAGNLVLTIGDEEIRQREPVMYQTIDGIRKPVAGGYYLKGKATAGFRVGDYDTSRPLVIDPVVTFSAFVGGKVNDQGWGVAVSGNGSVWIAGETLSKNLRSNLVSAALQTNYQGGHKRFGDGFVARFDNGTNLNYLTYLGGRQEDAAFGVAVDTNTGAAFITGYTDSKNFPLWPTSGPLRAYQTILGGTNLNGRRVYPIGAFVTKLDANGALVYSTYLGGLSRDVGLGIAVDELGRAYVTGLTESSNFPTVNALQGPYMDNGGHYDGSVYHRNTDAFVTRLNTNGTALDYFTYLGGSNEDFGQGIAVDSAHCAYVAGLTYSTNFPTFNVFQPQAAYLNNQTNRSSRSDGFVCKLSDTGQALIYSSYLGGSNNDAALAIAVDTSSNAYVTGYTFSTNFPITLTNFVYWPSKTNHNADVFVTRFNPAGGTNGGYSVVFGGKRTDEGLGITVDPDQNAYIVGITDSRTNFADTATLMMTNFFLANPDSGFSQTNSSVRRFGVNDAFLVELAPNGTNIFSGYLGGYANDQANGIALDLNSGPSPIAYIVGTTTTTNFPGANPATFHSRKKKTDAFVSRVQLP